MSRRPIACALGLALVLVLLPATLAGAEYRGTDMWSNLAPGGGLADGVPLSYYALDYHVDGPDLGLGGVGVGDVPALVAQFLAALLFMIATFFMRVTISAFDWAFNVDVIGGDHGALGPVGRATQHLWFSTFVPLLTTGALVLGGWMLYKLLARRFGEAGAGLVRATCLVAAALAIILNPGATIGKASALANDLASSIVSGTTGGNGGQDVSQRMFDTFIYRPWAVLQFGGLKRCVSSAVDGDGFPVPVGVSDPQRRICRDVLRQDAGGFGGYAPKFLRYAPGSDERKHLYEAIKDGEMTDDPSIPGWRVTRADAPAVDMMQAGGSVQRLTYVVLIVAGIVGAILFLGMICLAALFTQLGLLICLAATPAVTIAAIFPGTHGLVFAWAKWVAQLLVAKVIYALLLAAALGVSSALMAAGGNGQVGYLSVFFLQSALFIGLFVKRKMLAEKVTNARNYHRSESRARTFVAGAATAAVGAAAAPVAAAGVAAQAGKSRLDRVNQQHASDPQTQAQSTPAAQNGSRPSGARVPDSSSPPASAGREYSPNPSGGAEGRYSPDPQRLPVTSDADQMRRWNDDASAVAATMPERGEPVPTREFRADYEQAKAERAQVERPAPAPPQTAKPLNWPAGPESLAEALEQERAKTPST